jgi:hypothetical protein
VKLTVDNFFPEAVRQIKESPDGVPMVSFLATSDMRSGEAIVLARGETATVGEMTIGFDTVADITVVLDDSTFNIKSGKEIRLTRMQNMESVIYPPDSLILLSPRTVYTIGGYRIVPRQLTLSGVAVPEPATAASGQTAGSALECTLSGTGYEKKFYLWDNTWHLRWA